MVRKQLFQMLRQLYGQVHKGSSRARGIGLQSCPLASLTKRRLVVSCWCRGRATPLKGKGRAQDQLVYDRASRVKQSFCCLALFWITSAAQQYACFPCQRWNDRFRLEQIEAAVNTLKDTINPLGINIWKDQRGT